MKYLLVPALPLMFLAACASKPAFTHDAYVVKDTPVPGILLLRLNIGGASDDFRALYLSRAAAEECASRKFPYSDSAFSRDGSARAFCYAKASAPNLGANYSMKAAASSPSELRVEDTPTARPSPLRAWDVIRKIAGRDVHDIAELKEALFITAQKNPKEISVAVERSEIPLVVTSPLYADGAGLVSPEQLEDLRTKVP